MKRDKPYPCCVENTTSLCVFEDAMARWTEPYGIAAATPYQRNDFATKQPRLCESGSNKKQCVRLYAIKTCLLQCKTACFRTQNHILSFSLELSLQIGNHFKAGSKNGFRLLPAPV